MSDPAQRPVIGLGLVRRARGHGAGSHSAESGDPGGRGWRGRGSVRVASGKERRAVLRLLGLPVLVGLFGVAVALGALGRRLVRSGAAARSSRTWGQPPEWQPAHGAGQQPPAASLLSARAPRIPSAAGRTQHRPQPVRDRLAGLGSFGFTPPARPGPALPSRRRPGSGLSPCPWPWWPLWGNARPVGVELIPGHGARVTLAISVTAGFQSMVPPQ